MFYQIMIRAKDAQTRIRLAGYFDDFHNRSRQRKGGYSGRITLQASERKMERVRKEVSKGLGERDVLVKGPFRTNPTRGRRRPQ